MTGTLFTLWMSPAVLAVITVQILVLAYSLSKYRAASASQWLSVLTSVWVLTVGVISNELFNHAQKMQSNSLLAMGLGPLQFALAIFLLPVAWQKRAAIIAAVFFWIVTLANHVYFQAFGSILSPAVLSGWTQLLRVRASLAYYLTHLSIQRDLLLIAASIAAFAAFFPAFERPKRISRPHRLRGIMGGLWLITVGTTLWSFSNVYRELHHTSALYSWGLTSEHLGIVNQEFFFIYSALRDWIQNATPEPLDLVTAARRNNALPQGPRFGVARGNNLILIQVESLESFPLNLRVEGQDVTPFMNSLLQSHVLSFSLLDQTGDGHSSDAEYLSLNSMYPLTQGAVALRSWNSRFVALPRVLKEKGYFCFSSIPLEKRLWNEGEMHIRYGFDQSLFAEDLGPIPYEEREGWGLADRFFFERIVRQAPSWPRPFFAFLTTASLHHPFEYFPPRFKEMHLGPLEETPLGRYLHAVRHFDSSLEQLIRQLRAQGLLDHTVIALYGDHIAGLPWNPPVRAMRNTPPNDSGSAVRAMRVPFFVLTPKPVKGPALKRSGGQIDIAPSLLYLLGITPPPSFLGHSLIDASAPQGALRRDGLGVRGDDVFIGHFNTVVPDWVRPLLNDQRLSEALRQQEGPDRLWQMTQSQAPVDKTPTHQ